MLEGFDLLFYNYCDSFYLKLELNLCFLELLSIFGVKLFYCIKEIRYLDVIKCLMILMVI